MTPYVDDTDFTLYVGDALETLRGLPDEFVDCVCTSPPYWGLRDYGAEGQLGLEPTPDQYVTRMVQVFREVRRVLAAHGTCWVNLGDSYAAGADRALGRLDQDRDIPRYGSSGGGAGRKTERSSTRVDMGGLKPKDLCGVPWKVAFALQADGWYLRSDIIWSKPNPMPESVTDRPTKAHEYVFLFSKSPRYFWDQEAVRESHSSDALERTLNPRHGFGSGEGDSSKRTMHAVGAHPNGRNVRSVWEIATQPYPEAHFATYPEELVRRCLLAGCPVRVCRVCGKPSERLTAVDVDAPPSPSEVHHGGGMMQGGFGNPARKTLGWSDCGHNDYRPGVVLDPFLGSGTTALVARNHNRHAIGIELSAEYAELAAKRTRQLSLLTEGAA